MKILLKCDFGNEKIVMRTENKETIGETLAIMHKFIIAMGYHNYGSLAMVDKDGKIVVEQDEC